MALEDMVIQSENRLKELLGSTAMQVSEESIVMIIYISHLISRSVTFSPLVMDHLASICVLNDMNVYVQVIASSDLPLQIRLSMNTTRLQEIENAQQLGGYGWVGGLVVLVELRHRVASLREMLKLPPPCEGFTDLEEVIPVN